MRNVVAPTPFTHYARRMPRSTTKETDMAAATNKPHLTEGQLNKLRDAIHHVWQVIGPDVLECAMDVTNECCIEACMENFSTYCDDASAIAVKRELSQKYGHGVLLSLLAPHIHLV